ncbi:hypothetical protein EDC96DRAFT_548935 [Choanephora cucurbitarum]|nr:hypothetical protein EDC96DRAFT_548935 [Choanephora cucurbitarum]
MLALPYACEMVFLLLQRNNVMINITLYERYILEKSRCYPTLMLYCLILLAISKYLQKCSYSISFITATQLHIFTSVSDMNPVFGLACLSEFASSLFQISNMVVIVTHEGQEDCLYEPHSYQYEQF